MAISGRKWFFGCLLGCGGLMLIALIVVISFFVWLSRPGDLLDTERLLGEETVGYVEFTLSEEDPAARELLYELIDVSQQYNRRTSPFPDTFADFINRQSARSQKKDIDKLFPMVVAWTMSGGADGEPEVHLGTVSVEGLGNQLVLADWFMGFVFSREAIDDDTIGYEKYRGESIYSFATDKERGLSEGPPLVFYMDRSDIFLLNDREAARRAIDRTNDAAVDRAPTEFDRLYASIPELALRGAILNGNGELRRLWERLDPEADVELLDGIEREVRSATIDGGFVTQGDPELATHGETRIERSFALTLNFACVSAGCGDSGIAERMARLADYLREKDEALVLVSEATSEGLIVRGQARDIVGLVERTGQSLVDKAPTFEETIREKREERGD